MKKFGTVENDEIFYLADGNSNLLMARRWESDSSGELGSYVATDVKKVKEGQYQFTSPSYLSMSSEPYVVVVDISTGGVQPYES